MGLSKGNVLSLEKLLRCTRRIVAAALFSWHLSNFATYGSPGGA